MRQGQSAGWVLTETLAHAPVCLAHATVALRIACVATAVALRFCGAVAAWRRQPQRESAAPNLEGSKG